MWYIADEFALRLFTQIWSIRCDSDTNQLHSSTRRRLRWWLIVVILYTKSYCGFYLAFGCNGNVSIFAFVQKERRSATEKLTGRKKNTENEFENQIEFSVKDQQQSETKKRVIAWMKSQKKRNVWGKWQKVGRASASADERKRWLKEIVCAWTRLCVPVFRCGARVKRNEWKNSSTISS